LLAVIHLAFFEDSYTSSKMVLIKKSGQFQKKCIAAATHLIQNAIASLVINSETMKLFIDAFLTGLSSDMNRLCSLELERSKGKTAERSDVFFPCGVTRREPQREERGWWKEGARSMRAPDAYCPAGVAHFL